MKEKIEIIDSIIDKILDKDFNIYFLSIDTKGVASASVAHTYELVKILNESGYKAHLLYENNEYTDVSEWLGEEYGKLSHKLMSDKIDAKPEDVIIVPEVYANYMKQLKDFKCRKVVFMQSYTHMFELLGIGNEWHTTYGFDDVITTSEKQAKYVEAHFPGIRTHIVSPTIQYPEPTFSKPKLPTVGVVSRKQSDVLNLVKSFYLQYPILKWISFKDMRGLSKDEFLKHTERNCLNVWLDRPSTFGTFPLESITLDTPVLGLMPDMLPEWMIEEDKDGEIKLKNNGFWVENILDLPSMIYEYLNLWLNDEIPSIVLEEMNKSKGLYSSDKTKLQTQATFKLFDKQAIKSFNELKENIKKQIENEK